MIEGIQGSDSYQPGVCNIGPAEIRRRRQLGLLGLAAAAGLGAALLAVDAPHAARLLIAAPVAVGLEGLIQARLRFCAGFGLAGLQNWGELGEQTEVVLAEARAADRRKALWIHAASMAGGLAAAAAFTLLDV